MIPPEPVLAQVRQAAAAVREGLVSGVSLAGVEVAEALLGQRDLDRPHLNAMANSPYDPATVNGALLGGEPGKLWARSTLLLTASRTAARTERLSLAGLSDELNALNRRFRDRVEVALGQAMRLAIRRADRKAQVRARRASVAKLSPVRAEWDRRCYVPAVLAAISTEMAELLDESFDDAAEQVGLLFDWRQKQRRKLLAQAFADVQEDDLADEWAREEEKRGGDLRAFIVGAMFAEAARRLESPRDVAFFDERGEQPVDPSVPVGVAADVVRVADGAPVGPTGVQDPQVDAGTGQSPVWDYTDDLVNDLVATMVPGVVVTYQWETGEPIRPFEPHWALAGVTFTNETYWSVCAKDPGEYPEGEPAWMPGDHPGCQCSLAVIYEEGGDEGGDGG